MREAITLAKVKILIPKDMKFSHRVLTILKSNNLAEEQ